MKLVIAEKPSVAQSIAKVIGADKRKDGYMEGNGYIVSWCVGHLIELAEPQTYEDRYGKWNIDDLPIIPSNWKYQVSDSTKTQYAIIKTLMERSDVESLVAACDAGREGELIFRLVYHQANCRKPFERLWISSMEDSAIREGFDSLRPSSDYDDLYKAALCRERADWIVGINATRFFTVLYGQTLNVGRVMTPTLAMTVEREAEIAAFRKENFYTVVLNVDGTEFSSERFKNEQEAKALAETCKNIGSVQIKDVENKNRTEKPPLLYDLTSLQRDANRIYGFTAQQTLDYTQSLYEKKLVTYPRTDARYLTNDMENMILGLIESLKVHFAPDVEIKVNAAQVCNSSKVSDHHAIIPTKSIADADLTILTPGEYSILDIISQRLLMAVGEPYIFSEIEMILACADKEFKAKGKTVLQEGWRKLWKYFGLSKEKSEIVIPDYSVGENVDISDAIVKVGQTEPKKHFSEDTLLKAMENAGADEIPDEAERKGLGTPATRAAVIEKLIRIGFITRSGNQKTKYLIPTDKGKALITVMPEQIQSASLTADWEQKLIQVEHGEYAADQFMRDIDDMIHGLISTYKKPEGAEILFPPKSENMGEVIGKCPHCGGDVIDRTKGYFCSNRDCKFAIWKDNAYFKKIGSKFTSNMAENLISTGKVRVSNLTSKKTGNTYSATVVLSTKDDGSVQFQMEFDQPKKRR